jgi:hypothetical protein
MARIKTYTLDSNISLGDKLVGTDADDNSITKNYSIDTLGDGLISLKNIITGAGTLNAIPLWKPDGTKLGNSNIGQDVSGNITVGVNLTVVDDLSVEGGVVAENTITVGGSGVFNGPATFNDNSAFYGDTVFEGEVDFQTSVTANGVAGTAGQVLSSTGNNVQWVDSIETAQITLTNAQIQTLGTAPVEILPIVSGYIYQVLGATTQSNDSGGLNDEYDWQGQNGVISWRTTNLPDAHRVEIPNGQLPSGGTSIGGLEAYVGTPTAGSSRVNSRLLVGVTGNTDPIVNIGETPIATWTITVTYRLIPVN